MFNTTDIVNIYLNVYDKDYNELGISIQIPNYINFNFSLPENTYFIEIKEYEAIKNVPFQSTIAKIYLGRETRLQEILSSNKRVIIEDNMFLNEKEAYTKRILIEEDNSKVTIKQILNESDIALVSLEEIELYIRRLAAKISQFNQDVTSVKRLLNKK